MRNRAKAFHSGQKLILARRHLRLSEQEAADAFGATLSTYKSWQTKGLPESRVTKAFKIFGIHDWIWYHENLDEKTFQSILAGGCREHDQRPFAPPHLRSRSVAPDTFLHKLPVISSALFGREAELAWLDEAWSDPHIRLTCLVAMGGTGKTALVNSWLDRMRKDDYRGAMWVYGWSFYSQGMSEDRQVSADDFLHEALKWFGDDDPTEGSAWDKGVRLANLIRQEPTLLILDGLEPLQYPPGDMEGRLKDQGMQAFLRELSHFPSGKGLCVVSSRVTEPLWEGKTSVALRQLDHLSSAAGGELLLHLGVGQSTQEEREQASQEFDGHALALTLLGSYLAKVHHGEIRKRDRIPHLDRAPKQGRHARRVLASYESFLEGAPELDVLRLLGLFDRPAEAGALATLLQAPAMSGLTDHLINLDEEDQLLALANLRELHLVAPADDVADGSVDCHPLIREHFRDQIRAEMPEAWKAAHERLYDYYRNVPDVELPNTLNEMAPLFAAVAHGCWAGKHQEVLEEVYWKRIKRGGEHFSTKTLGAFSTDFAAVTCFFERPWSTPASNLTDYWKTLLLNWAGYRLKTQGRISEASEPFLASMTMSIDQNDWRGAATDAGNLCELALASGRIEQALDVERKAVHFADQSDDLLEQEYLRAGLGNVLHHAGKFDEAEHWFREAESLLQNRQQEHRVLHGMEGYKFCDFLITQGAVEDAKGRALTCLCLAQRHGWLLHESLYFVILGRLSGDTSTAKKHLDQALGGLRSAGRQDYLPVGLLARAAHFRRQAQFADAWRDAEMCREIAERAGLKLFLTDFHLEAAHLCRAEKKRKTAQEHLGQAKILIGETGYCRREADMAALKRALA